MRLVQCRLELSSQAKIVVGVPMLTSVGNLRFWLHLCQSSALSGAGELVQQFKDKSGDRGQFSHFARAYNQDLIQKVFLTGGQHLQHTFCSPKCFLRIQFVLAIIFGEH